MIYQSLKGSVLINDEPVDRVNSITPALSCHDTCLGAA